MILPILAHTRIQLSDTNLWKRVEYTPRKRVFLACTPHTSVDKNSPFSLRTGAAQRGSAQIEKEAEKKRKRRRKGSGEEKEAEKKRKRRRKGSGEEMEAEKKRKPTVVDPTAVELQHQIPSVPVSVYCYMRDPHLN
jgi:hypothetical protein